MQKITFSGSHTLHVGNLNFQLAEGSSGAPAAMPADPPSWLQLHDDDEPENEGWSS